ncbi:hypothetical protein GCM10023116_35920 [Kistimonas scapharcae]|uniref:VWFA domain-containing protein n=1 Tax=Kistimonas scapharcae TaxID=1036133 RepID=A0ABP8V740_9GAMM
MGADTVVAIGSLHHVSGNVGAMAVDGSIRQLSIGDQVYNDETLVALLDGSAHLDLVNGDSVEILAGQQLELAELWQQLALSVEQLIADGVDPSLLFPPPLAGTPSNREGALESPPNDPLPVSRFNRLTDTQSPFAVADSLPSIEPIPTTGSEQETSGRDELLDARPFEEESRFQLSTPNNVNQAESSINQWITVDDIGLLSESSDLVIDVLANDRVPGTDNPLLTLERASIIDPQTGTEIPAGKGAVSIIDNRLAYSTGNDFNLKSGESETVTVQYQTTDNQGNTQNANVIITVEDRTPQPLSGDVGIDDSATETLNLTLMLDLSEPMGWPSAEDASKTGLELMQEALANLLNHYQFVADLAIQVVTFSGGNYQSYGWYAGDDAVLQTLNTINALSDPQGGTYYKGALQEAEAGFISGLENGQIDPADHHAMYFITAGEPSRSTGRPDQAVWETFLQNHSVSDVHAVGFMTREPGEMLTGPDLAYLEQIAFPGNAQILDENTSDTLSDKLIETVPQQLATGDLVGRDIGGDGLVTVYSVDLRDGMGEQLLNTNPQAPYTQFKVLASPDITAGWLTVNYLNGEYVFRPADVESTIDLTFDFTVEDSDGSRVSSSVDVAVTDSGEVFTHSAADNLNRITDRNGTQSGTSEDDYFKDGGNVDDDFAAGGGNDLVVDYDAHSNTFSGEAGNDTLIGGGGDDRLYGGEDRDLLMGGRDHDILDGGSGDDVLIGGQGDDVMTGGTGRDDFRFSLTDLVEEDRYQLDRILDFTLGQPATPGSDADRLDFSELLDFSSGTDLDPIDLLQSLKGQGVTAVIESEQQQTTLQVNAQAEGETHQLVVQFQGLDENHWSDQNRDNLLNGDDVLLQLITNGQLIV